jgi:hypothetical protein
VAEQIQGGTVCPVQIVDDEEDWTALGQRDRDVGHGEKELQLIMIGLGGSRGGGGGGRSSAVKQRLDEPHIGTEGVLHIGRNLFQQRT